MGYSGTGGRCTRFFCRSGPFLFIWIMRIQGWPKELVMGCENFSNLCVVIGGTIGGVGRLRFFSPSLSCLFPQTCQKRVAYLLYFTITDRRALGHPFTTHNLGDLFPFKVKESQIPPQTPSSSYSLSGERGDEQTQADD